MKKIHIIILGIMLLGVGLLISASKDISTYATFNTAEMQQNRVKVAGQLVKDKEMHYNPEKDPNYFSFYLEDPDGKVNKVVLDQPKPQDFEMSEQVVVTGVMEEDTFMADEILLKCPSKYKDEEIAIRKNG